MIQNSNSRRFKDQKSSDILRVLLIFIENPLLRDPIYFDSLLKPICLLFGKIRSKLKQEFIALFIKLYQNHHEFIRIVDLFQLYITTHVNSYSVVPEESLISAVKALSILNHASEWGDLVPDDVFYNPTLCSKLNFKLEYRIWKKSLLEDPVVEFSYFNYPFLFGIEKINARC